MSKHPAATRANHESFCEREGWELVRRATGGAVSHHRTYVLHLHDGRILRTRISHPVDRSTYGRTVWRHILKDQLAADEEEFWACVNDGVPPDRGAPDVPEDAIPASLVWKLVHRAGFSEHDVAQMSKATAVAALNEYWRQASGPGE